MEPGSGEPGDQVKELDIDLIDRISQWSRVLENPVTGLDGHAFSRRALFSMEPGSGEPGDDKGLSDRVPDGASQWSRVLENPVTLKDTSTGTVLQSLLNGAGFWRTR